jgi:hypothetical protein
MDTRQRLFGAQGDICKKEVSDAIDIHSSTLAALLFTQIDQMQPGMIPRDFVSYCINSVNNLSFSPPSSCK